METVYVAHDGASMRREGERILVYVRGERRSEFTTHDVRQVVVMGNVTLTPAAIDLLVSRGIDTVLLSRSGKYRARIGAGSSGNIKLRMAQYAAFSAPVSSLDLARRIVLGKLSNQRTLLLRDVRRHGETPVIEGAIIGLQAAKKRSELAVTLDELRGCEGSGSAAYFRGFACVIRAPGFRFDGRNRRPPVDPVNALLSLGYTLLANAVESAVQIVGLDAYLGALHSPVSGRPSLVCDLMEEFRAPVVDALVAAAINKGAFKPDDFEDLGPGEPVVMKRETARWLITLFERRLEKLVLYPAYHQRLPVRGIIEQQVRAAARHVLGEKNYEAFSSR